MKMDIITAVGFVSIDCVVDLLIDRGQSFAFLLYILKLWWKREPN